MGDGDRLVSNLPPMRSKEASPYLSIDITLPDDSSTSALPPVCVLPGFMLSANNYGYLARRFASFGFIAFGVNIDSIAQKSMTDDNLASELSRLVWNDIVPLADNRAPYIVGHSKGANIAMHLAQSAAGCCLLDPVDFNTESIEGSSSVAEIVASLSSLPPVAIVGALNNRDIIDLSSSYRSFVAALPDCSCVEIEAGHLQFANDLPTLERYACASGPASDFEVQELSASIAVAHASQNDVRSVLTPNSHLCQR